jgi:rhodanese-related sulfurtransferase
MRFSFLAVSVLSLGLLPVMAGDGCGHEAKTGSMIHKSEIKTGEEKGSHHARFPEIKREELVKAIETKSVFLVDANGAESYAKGHIPGAINFAALGDKFAEALPQDKEALIVAYCGGPGCKSWCKAADKLDEMGYKNVRHFKGGIKEWKTAGLAVETPAGKDG